MNEEDQRIADEILDMDGAVETAWNWTSFIAGILATEVAYVALALLTRLWGEYLRRNVI